jgi:hypothetical protein
VDSLRMRVLILGWKVYHKGRILRRGRSDARGEMGKR